MIAIIIAMICIVALQQFFFMHEIHKLVDKVMSRSYTEYVQAKTPIERPQIRLDTEPADDLRTLQEFTI